MRRRLLTRHFVNRLFDNDLVSPHADAHLGAALGIAGLLSAGTFITVLMGARYLMTPFPQPALTALWYLDDAFLYVTVSMILVALVAVVAWDGLALDARDEAILGPLPIPRRTIVVAKLAAMGLLAGLVLAALNGPPTVIHPGLALAQFRVGAAAGTRLMAAHMVATAAAGLFGFCSVLALREVARAVLRGWWPAVSTRLQALLIVVLATAFLLTPGFMGRIADRLTPPAAADWRVAASPPMWFVGLHEVLAGRVIVDIAPTRSLPPRVQVEEDRIAVKVRGAQPGATPLAATALVALSASVSLALGAFLWNARRPAARARTPRRGGVPRFALLPRLIGATLARAPDVRAGFHFTLRTLGRSVPHRAALAVAAAFGLAFATIGFGRVARAAVGADLPSAIFSTQTMLLAAVLAGCEQAMRLPAYLPGAWSAKLAFPRDPRGYVRGVKRALGAGVVLPVLLLLLAVHLAWLDAPRAAAHFAVGLLVALCAIEARFLAEHPLPFLTAYTGGGRIKVAPFWFIAAVIGSEALAAIERAALRGVTGTLVLLGLLTTTLGVLWWLGRRRPPREDALDVFQPQIDEWTQLKLW
jgi:hypothetical protein